MTNEPASYVAATAAALELDIKPEWMPNVVRFFEIATSMAALVAASGALTDAESAPIFTPRDAE